MDISEKLRRKGWAMIPVFVYYGRVWRRGRASLILDYRGFVRTAKVNAVWPANKTPKGA